MARDRAVSAARQGHRPPARLAVARDRQRHFLRDALWLSVAPVAEGPSALEHGLSLVCSLARCLPVREDQPCAGLPKISRPASTPPGPSFTPLVNRRAKRT